MRDGVTKQSGRSPAAQIRALAGRVTRAATRDLERRLSAAGTGIGALAFWVMRLVARGVVTIADLSRTMDLSPATLVPVVDTLEQRGLLRRGRDPLDRRRNPLALTERGADLLARVPNLDEADALASALRTMGPGKTRHLLRLLRELEARIAAPERRLRRTVREP